MHWLKHKWDLTDLRCESEAHALPEAESLSRSFAWTLLWLNFLDQHANLLDTMARKEMTKMNHQIVGMFVNAQASAPNGDSPAADKS